MAEQHDRILGYFLEEANEHLETIERGLHKLAETVKQPATIRELFRAAHSIKGSAAMLGLTDVQQVGNQFEANFRLLKEQPHIEVDRQLQALFLESFSFLRAAINEVKVSNDPYRRQPNALDPVGDPVFEELKSYLQRLVDRTNPAQISVPTRSPHLTQDPALEQVFGEYVTRKLGEITSLCRQPDRPEIRTQLQKICQKLGNLGENFDFLEWTNLFAACRLAIVNPNNSLPQLAENISIAVKQAQRLVLADRHQSIAITSDLKALIDPHQSAQFTEEIPSTFKVDNPYDRFVENKIDLDLTTENFRSKPVSTEKYQSGSDLVSPFNLDTSAEFSNFNITDGVRFESGSIDSLMGVFDDNEEELLTESTWMAHESANNEITPKNLTDASTDLLVEMPSSQDLASAGTQPIAVREASRREGRSLTNDPQQVNRVIPAEISNIPTHNFTNEIVEPQHVVKNTVEISEIIQPQHVVEDDLENFDLAAPVSNQDLDDDNFWLDLTSAETSPPLYSELDRADNAGYQFQPDLPPAIELEISAPQFSLDPPLNELFPISIPTKSAQSSPPIDRSIEPTDPADNIEDWQQLDLSDLSDLTDRVESTAIPPNHESSFINLNPTRETAVPTNGASDPISEAELEDLFELEMTKGSELEAAPTAGEIERNDNNSIEPISGIFNYDNYNSFLDLDLNPEVSSNLVDLELNSSEYSADLSSSIDDNLAGLDLNLLDLDGELGSSIDDDLAGLDFLSQSSTELNSFAPPDLFDDNHLSERDLPDRHSFANLDLNSGAEERDIELPAPIDIAATHASSEIANPSVDITDEEESFGLELTDLDLDRLAQTESVDLSSSLDDFADLDLNLLDESDLSSDLTQSANLESLAELNLNFDEISGSFASDELKDLEGMLDANPSGNLDNVDNLELLLGTAALGIGGALAVGSGELDALDDLLGSPAPVNSADNLDDLDRLLAAPAAVAAPVDRATPKKSTTDRRSKQRTFEQTMRVSVRHLDNLNNLVGELVVSRNTLEQDQNRMRQFVDKLLSEVQRLNDVGKRMQDLYERSLMENSLIASRQQSKSASTPQAQARIEDLDQAGTLMEYDPLEMDRFTPIHMLSQKMIELTVRVRESTADIEFVVDDSTEVTRTLRQITGQLQEDLTKSRMIPFAQTADRLQRGRAR